MKKPHFLLIAILFVLTACTESTKVTSTENNGNVASSNTTKVLQLKKIAGDLNSPIGMVDASSQNQKRFFIAEQGGNILVLLNDSLLDKPLLSLKSKMVKLNAFYDERGLLGICLHPSFEENRKMYLYYSAPSSKKGSNHKSILAEYVLNPDFTGIQNDGKVILEIEQPESNHNGGQLAFGPDGMLYIALGDGGGANDEHGEIGNGQNLNTLLGKILRIDVSTLPYTIPKDNPFVNSKNKAEIYAYGLRNPWRFSFDKTTGRLFCADVGQNEYEEVNIIVKGGNYGWRIMEAGHCFNPSSQCDTTGLIMPIHEYTHEQGKSITGGFVYRGSKMPEMYGKYIFGDWTGPLFSIWEDNGKWTSSVLEIQNKPEDLRILSFAEDKASELYILSSREVTPESYTGEIYMLY
jgi:glucose/arabinose dehydrogenase